MSADITDGEAAPDGRMNDLRGEIFEAIRNSGPGPTVSAATDAAMAVYQSELAAKDAEIKAHMVVRNAADAMARVRLRMAETQRKRAERAEADLAEMTLCRDNAVRAAEHADQSINVDLEGLVADWVAKLGIEWTHGMDDRRLAGGFVDLVRPVIAHAVKRAELAEAALFGDNEGIRLWMLDCASLTEKHRKRAEQAEATIARVRDLHGRPRTDRHGSGCIHCGIVWPCPTYKALTPPADQQDAEVPDGD